MLERFDWMNDKNMLYTPMIWLAGNYIAELEMNWVDDYTYVVDFL